MSGAMPRLEDIAVFVSAADNGSLSAAARALDLAPAVASSALKRLEAELGARLLARSTRSLRLTQEGERYLAHARRALAELAAGRDALAQDRQALTGRLSLSMPSDLGRNVLPAWLDAFQAQHPGLLLQFRVNDHLTDMFKQPVDLVIRYGQPEDSTLVALPLALDNPRVLCAAPEYFARYGRPTHPEDLATHNCLRFALGDVTHGQWTFARDGLTHTVKVSGDRVCDDGDLVRRWALNAKGLAYKSRIDILADLRAGRLETALNDYQGESAPLYLLCPHRPTLSPAVNALYTELQYRLHGYLAGYSLAA